MVVMLLMFWALLLGVALPNQLKCCGRGHLQFSAEGGPPASLSVSIQRNGSRGLSSPLLAAAENELNLEGYPAGEALIRLIGFTFDYHRNHPDFVRLIQIENIHQARHLATSDIISAVNLSAIAALERLIKRGSEAGEFHSNNDALELHWLITSSCVFNITNRASFQQLYGANLFTDDGQDRLKKLIISSIMQTVLA
mgnify:CR=1 FL=1